MATGRPSGRNKKRRDGWADDPLVPIYGPHVAAALEWRGLSVNAAASKLGKAHPQQTLNSIVQGKTTRCRWERRKALAKLLGVPAGWLSGTEPLVDVPGYHVHRLPNAQRMPDGTWRDVFMVAVPGEPEPRLDFSGAPPILPPRVQLEAREVVRMLRSLIGPDGPVSETTLDLLSPETVLALLSLERWRSILFGGQRRGWHAQADESDEFAVAMATIIRLILKPTLSPTRTGQFDSVAQQAVRAACRWITQELDRDRSHQEADPTTGPSR